jgi:hypothetical protein
VVVHRARDRGLCRCPKLASHLTILANLTRPYYARSTTI